MDRATALYALQRWYDYDRIDSERFERRYPSVVEAARRYHAANGNPILAERAADHIDLYIEDEARNALAAMLLVEDAP